MASESYDQRSETLNEFGDQLLRQLRGGSGGGGGGGGGWSGGSSWVVALQLQLFLNQHNNHNVESD